MLSSRRRDRSNNERKMNKKTKSKVASNSNTNIKRLPERMNCHNHNSNHSNNNHNHKLRLPESSIKSYNDSNGSVHSDGSRSSSSSVYEEAMLNVQSESNRRKSRLQRLRFEQECSDTSLETEESSIVYKRESRKPRSIMQVRTLWESLQGSKLSEVRKKRRRVQLTLMNERNEISQSHSSGISLSFEGLSSTSSQTVQFDQIIIQEYAVIPGDNPAVSDGPPLALDWDPINRFATNVNTFEQLRHGNRRKNVQMKMPTKMRVAFLLQQNYSFEEIDHATHEAGVGRKLRADTFESLGTAEFEERIETLRKMITKPFRRKKGKDEDELRSQWDRLRIH